MENKQEAYEKFIEISGMITTHRTLDFPYHQNYFKLIGIDLSRQANMSISRQTNFVGKLDKDDGAVIFCTWKAARNNFKVFFKFVNSHRGI